MSESSAQSPNVGPAPPIPGQANSVSASSGIPRRRDKAQLSCTVCRRRKLRCDRNEPCGSCSSRGLSLSCVYLTNGKQNHRPVTQASKNNFQERINQLETMIVSLRGAFEVNQEPPVKHGLREASSGGSSGTGNVFEGRQSFGSPDSSVRLSDMFGRINIQDTETSYVGSEHWEAILDEVAELKDIFDDGEEQHNSNLNEEARSDSETPLLLFGKNLHATKLEIIAALPPRPVVDRLVSRYFDTMDMAPVVIHAPTFLKEYGKFWNNPMGTPTMWLGLLYSLMCLATLFHQSSEDELPSSGTSERLNSEVQQLVKLYRQKCVQCLILGNYTKSVPYTIETLLLYFTSEHFATRDAQVGTCVLFGMVVRMAMRMGYHRDPSHTPGISVFHGEMRRRLWATVVSLDFALSSQIGLPRILRNEFYDTAEPLPLDDQDLYEEIVELPPPRANADLTAVASSNVKCRILSAFGLVMDYDTSMRPCPFSEAMRIDQLLDKVPETIPPALKMRPMTESLLDPSYIIIRRIYLDSLFHKAKCMLHRRYLLLARSDEQYVFSLQICIASALQLLQNQSTLFHEVQPGGRLHRERWKVSSLTNYDFLLAATILCVVLDYEINTPAQNFVCNTRGNIIRALSEAYTIFTKSSKSSREAQKAARAIRTVLVKADQSPMARNLDGAIPQGSSPSFENQSGFMTSEATAGWISPNNLQTETISMPEVTPTSIPNEMVPHNMIDNFDWTVWDSQFQIENPEQFMYEQPLSNEIEPPFT